MATSRVEHVAGDRPRRVTHSAGTSQATADRDVGLWKPESSGRMLSRKKTALAVLPALGMDGHDPHGARPVDRARWFPVVTSSAAPRAAACDVEGVHGFDSAARGLAESGVGDRRQVRRPLRDGREEGLVEGRLGLALVEDSLGYHLESQKGVATNSRSGSSSTSMARDACSLPPRAAAISTPASTKVSFTARRASHPCGR